MATKPPSSGIHLPMPIWDLPVRLFHWSLLTLVLVSWISAENGYMRTHLVSGFSILALIIFRLAWGFVGSDTARFTQFVKSPLAALRHLSHFFRREPDTQVGHNEAGGLMVLGLLALLIAQVVTGLCANDDVVTEGPLVQYIGKELSDRITGFHKLNFKLLVLAVIGHVAAVIGYAVFKGHDLVRPMVTGRKRLPAATPAPRMVSPVVALGLFLVSAGIAVFVARVL